MSNTPSQTRFLSSIKEISEAQMATNNILASVIAAHAIYESNWGENTYILATNNLYKLPIASSWTGNCYSLLDNTSYAAVADASSKSNLIKIYSNVKESVIDWVDYIITTRRSSNGPFKYKNIVGVKSYKKAVELLIRDGYTSSHLHTKNDTTYEESIINIIESNNLFKWDEGVLSGETNAKKIEYTVKDADGKSIFVSINLKNAIFVARKTRGAKVYDNTNTVVNDPWEFSDSSPMYRVRLSWDRPDTQLIATKILEDAETTASAHKGYKVYQGDEGELVYDPWNTSSSEDTGMLTAGAVTTLDVVVRIPGEAVILDNAPVYRNADDNSPFIFLTGTYYYYDAIVYANNRVKIAREYDKNKGLKHGDVIGYINL